MGEFEHRVFGAKQAHSTWVAALSLFCCAFHNSFINIQFAFYEFTLLKCRTQWVWVYAQRGVAMVIPEHSITPQGKETYTLWYSSLSLFLPSLSP